MDLMPDCNCPKPEPTICACGGDGNEPYVQAFTGKDSEPASVTAVAAALAK